MKLTPELIADLRKKAKAAKGLDPTDFYPGQAPAVLNAYRDTANPAVVLAMVDRIEELEKEHEEMASMSLEELTGWRNSQ